MNRVLENLNRRAEKGRAAVLIVDAQNDFLHPEGIFARKGYGQIDPKVFATFVENCLQIAQKARSLALPVIHVRTALREDHVDSSLSPAWRDRGLGPESGFLVEGSWGSEIIEGLAPKEHDLIITKKGHGAFRGTVLDRLLTNLGVVHCFVAGFGGASGGADDTAREGSPLGYEMTILSDATYPADEAHLKTLDHKARVMSTGEALGFLRRREWPREAPTQGGGLGENLALLVVDLQNDSIHPQGANALYGGSKLTPQEFDMVVGNNQRLIAAMRKKGYSVIHTLPEYRADEIDVCASPIYYRMRSSEMPIGTKHRENSWGNKFVDSLEPAEGDYVLIKKTNSAFAFTHLHRLLRNVNTGTCIVTGGSIRGCVSDTIRDGIALGYQMVPVSDATYIPNSPYLRVLADRSSVLTTEEALRLLDAKEEARGRAS